MVSISVDLDLDDIGNIIDLTGNSESERREVLDFVLTVDRSMCEVDWSVDLITELAISTAQDMDGPGFADASITVNVPLPVPGMPDGSVNVPMAVKLPDLAQSLSKQTPHLVVQIMAEALFIQQEIVSNAKAERAAEPCGNCAHTRSYHHESDGETLACQDRHCMCRSFSDRCVLTACKHPMKAHNSPLPCSMDTHKTNCHPCAVAAKESR